MTLADLDELNALMGYEQGLMRHPQGICSEEWQELMSGPTARQ